MCGLPKVALGQRVQLDAVYRPLRGGPGVFTTLDGLYGVVSRIDKVRSNLSHYWIRCDDGREVGPVLRRRVTTGRRGDPWLLPELSSPASVPPSDRTGPRYYVVTNRWAWSHSLVMVGFTCDRATAESERCRLAASRLYHTVFVCGEDEIDFLP